ARTAALGRPEHGSCRQHGLRVLHLGRVRRIRLIDKRVTVVRITVVNGSGATAAGCEQEHCQGAEDQPDLHCLSIRPERDVAHNACGRSLCALSGGTLRGKLPHHAPEAQSSSLQSTCRASKALRAATMAGMCSRAQAASWSSGQRRLWPLAVSSYSTLGGTVG